jgi:isopenicillin N synthase-like dioxygenase
MELLEIGLDLPSGALTEKCTPPVSELRMNRYPSVSTSKFKEGLTKRNWAHSDFGVITLLFQDNVGGLELENRRKPGTFEPATKGSPNEMLVLVSDTFQRWSNGVVKSGLHQVGPPPSFKGTEDCILPERYSSVFFFKANRNVSVGPLPQFVGPQQPAKYDNISALQLHQQLTSILYK